MMSSARAADLFTFRYGFRALPTCFLFNSERPW